MTKRNKTKKIVKKYLKLFSLQGKTLKYFVTKSGQKKEQRHLGNKKCSRKKRNTQISYRDS